MLRLARRLSLAVFLLVPAGASAGPSTCPGLVGLRLPNLTVTVAEAVTSGSFTPPGEKPLTGLPPFCRLSGVLRPSSDSSIAIEVWMPASGWNHRFQGGGNGGFAGSIAWEGLARNVGRGYATAATDTGHQGSGIDASWALGHPEKVVDFGHRAIHEMTVAAKAVIAAYYGEGARRSYFASCSNGGRQALMEAQRHPGDYDGIVAGAPAAPWTTLMAVFGWNARALGGPASHVPPAKLEAVERAVLAACDAKDGVVDGVVADPPKCAFDPRSLLCTAGDGPGCLTAPQAEALARVYAGPRTRDGRRVGRGFPPGGETGPGGWGLWINGEAPGRSVQAMVAAGFGANMVFGRPDWDPLTFDVDRDLPIAREKAAAALDATDPDLEPFRSRGGKLILFHGWNDAAIPAGLTIDYVDAVRARLGAGPTDSFLRLYLVPGQQHCGGGPGASDCGGLNAASGDARHDLSTALEKWVEEGVAPGTMIAVRPADGTTPAGKTPMTRPLCPYPTAAVYRGAGSPDDPSSYHCEVR